MQGAAVDSADEQQHVIAPDALRLFGSLQLSTLPGPKEPIIRT